MSLHMALCGFPSFASNTWWSCRLLCGYQTCVLVFYSLSHWDIKFVAILVLLINGSFDWWQVPKKWNHNLHSNILGVHFVEDYDVDVTNIRNGVVDIRNNVVVKCCK